MMELQEEGDLFKICGAILFLESIIPIEYRAFQFARDKLYPELFVHHVNDTYDEMIGKVQACKYIDDHIHHDPIQHFIPLLNVLEQYTISQQLSRVISGMKLVKDLRWRFYENVNQTIL